MIDISKKAVVTDFPKVERLNGQLDAVVTILNANNVKALAYNEALTPEITVLQSFYDADAPYKDFLDYIEAATKDALGTINESIASDDDKIDYDDMVEKLHGDEGFDLVSVWDYPTICYSQVGKYIEYSSDNSTFAVDETAFMDYVEKNTVYVIDETPAAEETQAEG